MSEACHTIWNNERFRDAMVRSPDKGSSKDLMRYAARLGGTRRHIRIYTYIRTSIYIYIYIYIFSANLIKADKQNDYL